ncbi:MAG TPA: sugar ABC transporter substrate-binding protein [Propionibacteriaceae bacterium]
MSRRSATTAATALLLLVAGCSGGADAEGSAPSATGGFDWKRFSGQSISMLASQNPWQAAIEPLVPEFEALTGMTVKVESLPEDQFRQRRQVALTGRADSFDVYMTQPVQDGARFHQLGWYENLKPYLSNAALTAGDYDFADYPDTLIEGATFTGDIIGIPVMMDVEMFYYRKDILQKAGVAVPSTMEELEKVAAAIDDPNGVRAYAARGKGAAAVTQMSTLLYNFGADWTNSSGMAAYASPEGVKAFQFYGEMLSKYAPKGVTGSSWEELLPQFAQGRIAMWHDSSSFVTTILDPKNSTQEVRDNLGYEVMPSGPGGQYNATLPWAVAMNPHAKKKDAAWLFIQWATSKDVVTKVQASGVAGGRSSVPFPDSLPAEWVEVFKKDLAVARPKLPAVIPVGEVRDVIGEAIVTCIDNSEKCADKVVESAGKFDQIVKAS